MSSSTRRDYLKSFTAVPTLQRPHLDLLNWSFGPDTVVELISKLSSSANEQVVSAKDSTQASLAGNLMQLDRDVFAVAIFGFSGKLEGYVAKEFFATKHRKESSMWKKAAMRHAAIVKLANEDFDEYNPAAGIVFFRKEYKQILIPIPESRIIIEAVMPLWNHSTVFFEGVHKFFEKR